MVPASGHTASVVRFRLIINVHLFGGTKIDYLSRDYLSILYLPLIPLGLSALDFRNRRISLKNKFDKATVVVPTQRVYMYERKRGWVRLSWLLAFVVAASGALLGYLAGGYDTQSWQPGLWTVLVGLVGCGVVNRLFLAAIG